MGVNEASRIELLCVERWKLHRFGAWSIDISHKGEEHRLLKIGVVGQVAEGPSPLDSPSVDNVVEELRGCARFKIRISLLVKRDEIFDNGDLP